MKVGLLLAVFAIATSGVGIASYLPKMRRNVAPLRPRLEQGLMTVAIVAAAGALLLGPGLVGGGIAVLALLPSFLFILGSLASGLPDQPMAVGVGELAPDFTTYDSEGQPFRLSSLLGSPVLLKFYRGYWCPYCVAELAQLDRVADEFAAMGVKLIAVSSDTIEELGPFQRKKSLKITLLADPELEAHRIYNVAHRNFTLKRGLFRDLAIPTTILIDREGRVLWFEQSADFRVRPQAASVLATTRRLLAATAGTATDARAA